MLAHLPSAAPANVGWIPALAALLLLAIRFRF
jgi:hypothetical protein